jgi:cysteine-rich repeat protein
MCDDGNLSNADCCSSACLSSCPSEIEPNNTSATATPLVGGRGAGAIEPIADQDFWSFTIGVISNVRVETFDASGSTCAAINTVVELRGPDGTTVLVSDNDDGIALCSLIDPATDMGARALPPGTYYVRVTESGDNAVIPAYSLRVTTTAFGCGDGILIAAEQCDDGNLMSGDGCSATCTVEGTPVVREVEPNEDGMVSTGGGSTGNDFAITGNGPFSADVIIDAAIMPVGDEDVFVITNPTASPVSVTFQTGTNATGTECVSADTYIHIRNALGMSLASDDDGAPVGTCSMLTYMIPATTTVYAHVFRWNDGTVIPRYFLIVNFP